MANAAISLFCPCREETDVILVVVVEAKALDFRSEFPLTR